MCLMSFSRLTIELRKIFVTFHTFKLKDEVKL